MALNFSHRLSLIGIANREVENWSRAARGVSQESVSNDILDLLPSDPFGMDISTSVTAITGWLEDLEVDYGGYGVAGDYFGDGEYEMFDELNFIWNNTMWFQSFAENSSMGERTSSPCCSNNGVRIEEPILECGALHAALPFALGYLGVRDLTMVECVCKSLRSTVQNDPLLWRKIHIHHPLNERINDDVVLKLSSRSQGQLQCLSLVECPWITDECLKQVIDANPRLIKLSVPGCSRISIDAIVNSLKEACNLTGRQGIKNLRIGGLRGTKQEHLDELMLLLGTQIEDDTRKPHFFHQRSFNQLCDDDDDRAIDIETCPRCHDARLVYDCPAEGCQGKKEHEICRACSRCINRCVQCGRCINNNEYEETFCLEMLCFKCDESREMESSTLHG